MVIQKYESRLSDEARAIGCMMSQSNVESRQHSILLARKVATKCTDVLAFDSIRTCIVRGLFRCNVT